MTTRWSPIARQRARWSRGYTLHLGKMMKLDKKFREVRPPSPLRKKQLTARNYLDTRLN